MTTKLDQIFDLLQEPTIKQLLSAFWQPMESSEALRNASQETLDEVTRNFLHRIADLVNSGSSFYAIKTNQEGLTKNQLRQIATELKYKIFISYPFINKDFDGVLSARNISSLRNLEPFNPEAKHLSNAGLFSLKDQIIVEILKRFASNKTENLQRLRELFARVLQDSSYTLPILSCEVSTGENISPMLQPAEGLKSGSDIVIEDIPRLSPVQSHVTNPIYRTEDKFDSSRKSLFPLSLWQSLFIGALTGAGLAVVGKYFLRVPSFRSARVSNICFFPIARRILEFEAWGFIFLGLLGSEMNGSLGTQV